MAQPGPVAFDTEYLIGDDETTPFRAAIYLWSVAYPGRGERNARGVIPAVVFVLPPLALTHPAIQEWLTNPAYTKWAHNAGVDRNAIENYTGYRPRGVRDSLGLARWLFPSRVPPMGAGFGLDSLGLDLLGYGKTEEYLDLVRHWVPNEQVQATKTETKTRVYATQCVCGDEKCKKRKLPVHAKMRLVQFPLSDITTGHPHWDRLLVYSAQDSIVDCELVQLLLRMQLEREVPWYQPTTLSGY